MTHWRNILCDSNNQKNWIVVSLFKKKDTEKTKRHKPCYLCLNFGFPVFLNTKNSFSLHATLQSIDAQCVLPTQCSINVSVSGLFRQTSNFLVIPRKAVKPIPLQALHIPAKEMTGGCESALSGKMYRYFILFLQNLKSQHSQSNPFLVWQNKLHTSVVGFGFVCLFGAFLLCGLIVCLVFFFSRLV